MSTTDMTIDEVKRVLLEAVATEAGIPAAELATDRPFTDYGLDSMAALTVGMEIEDVCGLSDLPVDLLWDHPTVDTLSEALWKLMNAQPVSAATDGPR
ncbi:acyl carrier protein [Streptomyces sp. LN245]|uniref:acyl carrier protein n=1 Tax=Streptomyces sp. LN245 TaxID=3112975 RepID=UPI0037243509